MTVRVLCIVYNYNYLLSIEGMIVYRRINYVQKSTWPRQEWTETVIEPFTFARLMSMTAIGPTSTGPECRV